MRTWKNSHRIIFTVISLTSHKLTTLATPTARLLLNLVELSLSMIPRQHRLFIVVKPKAVNAAILKLLRRILRARMSLVHPPTQFLKISTHVHLIEIPHLRIYIFIVNRAYRR